MRVRSVVLIYLMLCGCASEREILQSRGECAIGLSTEADAWYARLIRAPDEGSGFVRGNYPARLELEVTGPRDGHTETQRVVVYAKPTEQRVRIPLPSGMSEITSVAGHRCIALADQR